MPKQVDKYVDYDAVVGTADKIFYVFLGVNLVFLLMKIFLKGSIHMYWALIFSC